MPKISTETRPELAMVIRLGQTRRVQALPPGMPRDAPRRNRRAGERHRMPAVSAGVRWVEVGATPFPAERIGGRAGYEASSNQSLAWGGSRADAKVAGLHGSPRPPSTARVMAESTTSKGGPTMAWACSEASRSGGSSSPRCARQRSMRR